MLFNPANLRHSFHLSFSLGLGGDESLLGLLPVDNLPEVLEVLGTGVPVVDIVSMLPDIAVNNRDKCGTLLFDIGLV